MRESRKLDHLKFTLCLEDGPRLSGFSDICIVHNAIPNLCWQELDLKTSVAGLDLAHPIIINAVTGGAHDVAEINAKLAEVAGLTGAAMAVGSQYAGLENPAVVESYTIVRKINPDGIILANLGAHATVAQAKQAVEMVGASAIQIHLNAAQEIFMLEGDRDFRGYLDNIAAIACKVGVPVIAKEVGFGIAREQAILLAQAGVKAIDIGGAGGTNFIAIEAARRSIELSPEALQWGMPTAVSAAEVFAVVGGKTDIIVSGGVRTPLDAIKALAIGGQAVGMAAPIVRAVKELTPEETAQKLLEFLDDMKRFMILSGARTVADLLGVPIVITGQSKDWLEVRGIDLCKFAQRKKHG